jgi:hypothetical protein
MAVSFKWGVILAAIAAVWYARVTSRYSVIMLALHYLARPHTEPKGMLKPINLRNAWNGSYMSKHPEIWTYELTNTEKETFSAAIAFFETRNKSLINMTPADFPLDPMLLKTINGWKTELSDRGRGFQLIRGVPVRLWSMKQSEIFFFALGLYLGIPGAQDVQGNLLHHVTDIGPTKEVVRPYRQKVDIAYHCDGADIVGLLCMHPAKRGGESRIVSSAAVFNELLKLEKGQLYARRLFDKTLLFTRKTFGLSTHMPVHPLRQDSNGVLRTYWNQEYYSKSYRNPDGTVTAPGSLDPLALEAIEAYDGILSHDNSIGGSGDLGLSMNMQQGDIQLLSNHFILHARTEFEDFSNEEISASTSRSIGKRDLLRLWVSHTNEEMSWSLFIDKQIDLLRVLSGLIEGAWKYR